MSKKRRGQSAKFSYGRMHIEPKIRATVKWEPVRVGFSINVGDVLFVFALLYLAWYVAMGLKGG